MSRTLEYLRNCLDHAISANTVDGERRRDAIVRFGERLTEFVDDRIAVAIEKLQSKPLLQLSDKQIAQIREDLESATREMAGDVDEAMQIAQTCCAEIHQNRCAAEIRTLILKHEAAIWQRAIAFVINTPHYYVGRMALVEAMRKKAAK